jgi:hypothetical protein
MTDHAWPFYPLAFLHDAARCLALAHQGQLSLNVHGRLQISSVTRLADSLLLRPEAPHPHSEAQAPELGFLIALLGRAGFVGVVEDTLHTTNAAHDWLALPVALQIGALRQVWWHSPTLDGRWLPSTRHRRPQDSYWRQVILEVCGRASDLPPQDWTLVADIHAYLATQSLLQPGAGGNLFQVRRARERRTLAVARFLLQFVLPVLSLVELDADQPEPLLRPTPEGQTWLRDALDRDRHLAEPSEGAPDGVAVEVAVPHYPLNFPAPTAPPLRVADDLRVSLDLAAPAAFTFELAHFAELRSPGPPACYQVTRPSLEAAIARGYSISEIHFLLARFAEAPLPPAAAQQLDAWREAMTIVSYQPGYRLSLASSAILDALRQRQPFRRRTQPLASGQHAWVDHAQAKAVWRYLRRLGYEVRLQEGEARSEPGLPRTAPHRPLPLTPLLVALGTYRTLRRAIPTLAELPSLADLEGTLAEALSPDERAAAQHLLASHAALLDRHLQAPTQDGEGLVDEDVADRIPTTGQLSTRGEF